MTDGTEPMEGDTTIVQTFMWFAYIKVLLDGDLRVQTLHIGCAKMLCISLRKKKTLFHNAVDTIFCYYNKLLTYRLVLLVNSNETLTRNF